MSDDVSLREHLERLISENDRRYEQRFVASEEAVKKAEKGMSARLDSMNEFRDALRDQSDKMATRTELEKVETDVNELRRVTTNRVELAKVEADVNQLRRDKASLDGRLMVVTAAISFGISLLIVWVSQWLSSGAI